MEVLLDHGTGPTRTDEQGQTAADLAASHGHDELAKCFSGETAEAEA